MSGSQISVICPSCDEHFLVDVVDITAHAQLAAAQQRIVELEAQHAALHGSLRRLAAQWADAAAAYDNNPRCDDKSETLRRCAHDLRRTFGAALAGDEPAKDQ